MKKYVKLLVCLTMATALLFSLTGCFERPVDPEIPENDGNVETTIEDAYEHNRPDYDGIFDYDSEYVPMEPTKPVEEFFTVTLDESSPIKFADGTKSKEVKKGDYLTSESFDMSDVSEKRELLGFLGIGEEGNKSLLDLEDCRVWENLTLTPYFSPEAGFTALDIGSGKIGRFNFDFMPGSIAVNKTITYQGSEIVAGGGNSSQSYAELGGLITEPSYVTIGSAFRLDSKYKVTEGVYEVAYNFENKDDVDLHLDVYQVSKGTEHNNSLSYESTRYRVDVDLAPGESMRYTGQYYLTDNENILPYVVADRSMESMKFGMSLSVRARPDLTEPETKPSLEPDPTAKLTLNLPDGITVSDDFIDDVVYGEQIVVPSSSQITNETGREIGGWYIVGGDSLSFVTSSTVMPESGLTIAPYFAPEQGTLLVYGSGKQSGQGIVDYFGNTEIEAPDEDSPDYPDYAAQYDSGRFTGNDVIVNGERGVKLTHNGTLVANDYFRVKTSVELLKNYKYKYYYTFTNNGESSISFDLWQLRSALDMTDEGAVSTPVTVPAGETVTAVINEIKYDSANTNALTMLVMKGEVSNLDLTVRMAFENLGEDQSAPKYALTIGGISDVTFADGEKTAMIGEGTAIPTATSASGRKIAGWCDGNGNKITSFSMPAEATTVYPYFEALDGYKRLWLLNGKNYGVPSTFSDTALTENDFEHLCANNTGWGNELDSMKTIVRGKNNSEEGIGFAEEGMLFKCNKTVEQNAKFRCDTIVYGGSDGFQIMKDKTYGFSFNFENKGSGTICFTVWIINTGSDTSTCTNNEFTINLEPGEYTTVTLDVTYVKPGYLGALSNNNMLLYFRADAEMTDGFALGTSIAIEKPTA